MGIEGWIAKQEACHGIAPFAGRIPRIGKCGGEIEAAVALIGLIDRQLPAAEVGTNLERVRTFRPGQVVELLKGVLPAIQRKRAGLTDSKIAGGRKNRQVLLARRDVRIRNPELIAEARPGAKLIGT